MYDPRGAKDRHPPEDSLGGLIIKAGLAPEEPAVLLGMLTAGAKVLNSPNAMDSRRRWKELGDRAFDQVSSIEFLSSSAGERRFLLFDDSALFRRN